MSAEVNRAVAERLGWTVQFNEAKGLYELLTPAGLWIHPTDADGSEAHCWDYVPEWSTDLNACAELRRGLSEEERAAFVRFIHSFSSAMDLEEERWFFVDASAEMQARAFLAATEGRKKLCAGGEG